MLWSCISLVQDIASATNKIRCLDPCLLAKDADRVVELNWLFNITINDISVIYVTARGSRYRILIKLGWSATLQHINVKLGFVHIFVMFCTKESH